MNDVEKIGAYYRAILPYYDASLEDRGDLPFWESIVRRWGSRHVLELGCGTGRVTAALARHASVTAVDLLIEMLHRARSRVPKARLVAADLRSFAFSATFDLIVLADDPMAHVTSPTERMDVLRRIAGHLTPGGRVVIEGLYRTKPVITASEEWTRAREDDTWTATYRYQEGSSVVEATSVMRSWSLAEVARLPEAGLETEAVWGDFEGGRFEGSSERMVIVATLSPRA